MIFFALVFASATPGVKTFADLTRCDTTEIAVCRKQGQTWVYKLTTKMKHHDFPYKGRPDVELWEMNDWCVLHAPTK